MTQLVDDLSEVLGEGRFATTKQLAEAIINLMKSRGEIPSNYFCWTLPNRLVNLIADIRKSPDKYGFNIHYVSNEYRFYWQSYDNDSKFKDLDPRRTSATFARMLGFKADLTRTRNRISQLEALLSYEVILKERKTLEDELFYHKNQEFQILAFIERLSKVE